MAVMVSISGYSSVAIQEAAGERTPLLLFDHTHLYLVLSGIMGLGDVVERVRRHQGSPTWPTPLRAGGAGSELSIILASRVG